MTLDQQHPVVHCRLEEEVVVVRPAVVVEVRYQAEAGHIPMLSHTSKKNMLAVKHRVYRPKLRRQIE